MYKEDIKMGIIVFGLFFLFYSVILGVQTKIEQNTFNKFSKTKATFIEALFTNLRVMPD